MDLLEAIKTTPKSKSRRTLPSPPSETPVSELSLSLLRQKGAVGGNFSLNMTQDFEDRSPAVSTTTPKRRSRSSKMPSLLPSSPFLPQTPSSTSKSRHSSTAMAPQTLMNATQKMSGVWRYTGGHGVEAKEQPAVRSMAMKLEIQYDNAIKVISDTVAKAEAGSLEQQVSVIMKR